MKSTMKKVTVGALVKQIETVGGVSKENAENILGVFANAWNVDKVGFIGAVDAGLTKKKPAAKKTVAKKPATKKATTKKATTKKTTAKKVNEAVTETVAPKKVKSKAKKSKKAAKVKTETPVEL